MTVRELAELLPDLDDERHLFVDGRAVLGVDTYEDAILLTLAEEEA